MKEIIEAFATRVKSPVFGYLFISWFGFNWEKILLLLFSKESLDKRIEVFKNAFNYDDFLLYPLGMAILFSILYPWINYVFLIISKKTY
jgi:hypothetical protein